MRYKKMSPYVKADPVLSWFWRRIYRYDQNVLMIVCGQTGSCKSGSAITIAKSMDANFDIDRVVFKADDFVKLVSGDLPKGSVIIWDEIGVEHDSREYYTTKNKLIKYVMQTFRYKNFMLIMTVPDLKSVDIGTRRLLHCYLEMHGPTGDKRMAKGMLRFVQINPRSGKEYYKMPRQRDDMWKQGLTSYFVRKPVQELEVPYKAKKVAVTESWYKDFNKQLEYMKGVLGEQQELRQTNTLPIKDLANKLMKTPLEAYDGVRKRFSGALVKARLAEDDITIGYDKALTVAQYLNLQLKKGEMVLE